MNPHIFIGTDSGATTTKIAAVRENGDAVSTKLLQRPTNSANGREPVIAGWIGAIDDFLSENRLTWEAVGGVGLAIPGPYLGYGIMDKTPNLPESFRGWNVHVDYQAALGKRAAREIPLVMGNDGNFGGVAEARVARGGEKTTVLMLMPGSGLGCAFIGSDGLPLEGDTLAGLESGHAAAAVHMLGLDCPPFPCGCGRDWGCVEAYTTISGLPHLLTQMLKRHPSHELATSPATLKEKVLSLRTRAQKGDPLALEIFDFQAKVMGLHVANLVMTLDPGIVIIGGGLMDLESTTEEFRARYLRNVDETARPYLWSSQKNTVRIVPASLGDLSQAVGAALVALHKFGAPV